MKLVASLVDVMSSARGSSTARGQAWATTWGNTGMLWGCCPVASCRAFVLSQQSRNRGPAIPVHFDGDGLMILGFDTHKQGRLEMLNRIGDSRPHLIVRLEMKSKIRAEPAKESRVEISIGSDTGGTMFEERAKVKETWAC